MMLEAPGDAIRALAAMAIQLLLGSLVLRLSGCTRVRGGSRRRSITWARAARRLASGAAWTLACATVAAVAWGLYGGWPGVHRAGSGAGLLAVLVVAGVPATCGCYLVVDAGRLEARGRWRTARRQVRLGGLAMAAGLMALAPIVVAIPSWRLGGAAIAGGTVAGLLAGLTGKPRPTGYFAALLYATGLAVWLAAAASR